MLNAVAEKHQPLVDPVVVDPLVSREMRVYEPECKEQLEFQCYTRPRCADKHEELHSVDDWKQYEGKGILNDNGDPKGQEREYPLPETQQSLLRSLFLSLDTSIAVEHGDDVTDHPSTTQRRHFPHTEQSVRSNGSLQ